jgi:alkylation response protein AidB-like acyl-CoA dehydrogenase
MVASIIEEEGLSNEMAAFRAASKNETMAAESEMLAPPPRRELACPVGVGAVPERCRVTLALAYASSLCEEAICLLQRTLGSSTASLGNPIQRFARDARVLNSHGAMRLDPQAEITGRKLLGLEPFLMMGGAVPDVSAR